jgi:hypothetical protein
MSEIAINALRDKRAELAGLVIHHQREIERLRGEIVHLDAVLRIFAPDSKPEHILPKYRRPRRSEYLVPGEIRRRCLDAMRDDAIVVADQIVVEMMRDKGLDAEGDRRLRSDLLKRALRALDALRRLGRVEKIGQGRGVQWRLASAVPIG